MNKRAIKNTAIAFWCEEDGGFIVQSPLFEALIGAGDTIPEASKEFDDMLSDTYEAYLEGHVEYDKPGRPTKNRTALNVDVQTRTRQSVKDLAKKLECSQGEVVDFLLSFYEHRSDTRLSIEAPPKAPYKPGKNPVSRVSESSPAEMYQAITDLQSRLTKIEQSMRTNKKRSK